MTFFENIIWLIHWIGMVPISEFKNEALAIFIKDRELTVHGEYVYSRKLFDEVGIDVRSLSPAQKNVLETVLGEGGWPADSIKPQTLGWLVNSGLVVTHDGMVYDARLW